MQQRLEQVPDQQHSISRELQIQSHSAKKKGTTLSRKWIEQRKGKSFRRERRLFFTVFIVVD